MHSAKERRRAVAAGAIGNFVEWFDFAAYGVLAVVIARHFFPSDNPTASLLSTFAAFAVAFVCRPLGGIIWGYIGDRWGRREALSSSVFVMSLGTVGIGLLPTAEAIGSAAAVLLVLCRCLQGLAAGAEWSGSAVYLVEVGNKNRRALSASLTPFGAWMGSAAGVAFATGLTATFGTQGLNDWAWRLPFLLAAPLGLVGVYLRSKLDDTPAFEELKKSNVVERAPIREALRSYWKLIILLFLMAAGSNTATYGLTAFMTSYLTREVQVPLATAMLTNTIALLVAAGATLVGGLLADRFGRKKTYLAVTGLLIVLVVPCYLFIGRGDFLSILIGQCVLGALVGAKLASIAVLCVELFPARIRFASSALAYSLGAGIFGGAGPLIATALIASTGQALAPAYYLLALLIAVIIMVMVLLRETVHLPLEREEHEVVPNLTPSRTPSV